MLMIIIVSFLQPELLTEKGMDWNTLMDMEEVSDSDDAGKSSDESEEVSEIDSDEDLRLTSTDEEKESKKAKKEKRKPRDDPERVRARKQRELRREILRWILLVSGNTHCQIMFYPCTGMSIFR